MKPLIAIWFLCAGIVFAQLDDSLIVSKMSFEERMLIVAIIESSIEQSEIFSELNLLYIEPAQRLRMMAVYLENREKRFNWLKKLLEYTKRFK